MFSLLEEGVAGWGAESSVQGLGVKGIPAWTRHEFCREAVQKRECHLNSCLLWCRDRFWMFLNSFNSPGGLTISSALFGGSVFLLEFAWTLGNSSCKKLSLFCVDFWGNLWAVGIFWQQLTVENCQNSCPWVSRGRSPLVSDAERSSWPFPHRAQERSLSRESGSYYPS